jgi:hypothetical protein
MPSTRIYPLALMLILIAASLFPSTVPGQSAADPFPQSSRQRHPPPWNTDTNAPDPALQRALARQAKARNVERHKQLVADTDKLLQLATELKASVDKSNKDTLSVEVVRKAGQIEKLARSVREKMKAG